MNTNQMEASFITLAMSIASAAAMSLGLAPNPQTKKTEVDVDMARFNIDLLDVLSRKTKGNLAKEEDEFMTRVLADLKLKFVEVNKHGKSV
ncbi:MAG: DUF1844 domain-containing protein [Oligoflexia bacterium]|nr:DUF1844 domain-containing protein [Oligoflexia bacterium]